MALDPVSKAQIGICPGCGARLRFQSVELGEFVVCEECGDELEVVRVSPIKLDWAYADPLESDEYDDDFDDDDYDFDDDEDDDYESYEDEYDWDDD